MSLGLKSAIENRPLINQILKQCADIIIKWDHSPGQCGLFGGLSGDLLFLYKLNQYDPSLVDEALFNDKLEFLQQQLGSNLSHPSLGAGLSGQGWLLEYLNQDQGEEYDPQLCEDIDEILLNTLSIAHWPGEIEMVSGLAGIAVYAGRRQMHTAPAALFAKLIEHFSQLASQTGDKTLSWSQPAQSYYRFNKDNPDSPEFNLGLAHGMPGIIAAILPALNIGSLAASAKTLLLQSCDWLLEQQSTQPTSQSCFGSCADSDNPSRLGWCYGDLTIALTLARVGKALDHPAYLESARQIALHGSERDHQSGMIRDAGLCHGSAGLSLIFQLLYKQLEQPQLLEAANKWLHYTLDLYQQQGLVGFYEFLPVSAEYKQNTGLLMGYGGIGLSLLAAISGDSDWVDCLLMA